MQVGGSGLLIIVIGLVVLYLGVTGRYKCLSNLVACIGGDNCSCQSTVATTDSGVNSPLSPLKPLYPR